MTRLKCLRCGGQDFHETEQYRYHDIEVLEKENKNTCKRQLICLKCNFGFDRYLKKCVM